MYLFNYIYFVIITLLGAKFLFQQRCKVEHPLHKKKYLLFDGPELFWVLTFSTGLLAFSAPGALDLMAIRLMVLEVFCVVGLFIVKRKPVWSLAVVIYSVYMLWLVIGIAYSPAPVYGFRVILKYMYPILILLFASAAVRHQEVVFKAGLGARQIAIASIAVGFIPFIGHLFPGVFWYGAALTINYISMCIFSLALFYQGGRDKKDLVLTVIFMLPCILWVLRTSIMGTTLALMMFFFFKYKAKSLPVIFGVLILFIASIFFIPSIKEKMFFDKEKANTEQLKRGEISMDNINSNGRFAMWEALLNRFHKEREMIGSGTGSTQNYMYNNRVFGGLQVPHNDYVQILCDNGLIALFLYFLSTLAIILQCFIEYTKKNNHTIIKICAITAGSTLSGVLLTMYTDNVVNYSMATLSYPFGFYGMMLGLIANQKRKKQ